MKKYTKLKELLEDFIDQYLERCFDSNEKADSVIKDFTSSNSLALGKPRPLAKNKQFEKSCKKLTQCMIGRDAECNHPKCPVTEKDMQEGRYCTLPLYDWRE